MLLVISASRKRASSDDVGTLYQELFRLMQFTPYQVTSRKLAAARRGIQIYKDRYPLFPQLLKHHTAEDRLGWIANASPSGFYKNFYRVTLPVLGDPVVIWIVDSRNLSDIAREEVKIVGVGPRRIDYRMVTFVDHTVLYFPFRARTSKGLQKRSPFLTR